MTNESTPASPSPAHCTQAIWENDIGNAGETITTCRTCGTYKGNPCRRAPVPAVRFETMLRCPMPNCRSDVVGTGMLPCGIASASCGHCGTSVMGDNADPVTAIKNWNRLAAIADQPSPARSDMLDAEREWRRLALQFDGHRMAALGHLRMMLQDPVKHAPIVTEFLSAPPLNGDKVLAERIAELAESAPSGAALAKLAAFPLEEGAYETAPDSRGLWRFCDWQLTVGDVRAARRATAGTTLPTESKAGEGGASAVPAEPASQQCDYDRAFDPLYGAVMNIQVSDKVKAELEGAPKGFYLLGHRDARHAAADLIAEFASRFRARGRNTCNKGTSEFAATAVPGDLPPEPKQLYYWNGLTLVTIEAMREYGRACLASNAGAAIPEHLREFVEAIAHNFSVLDEGEGETYCKGCSALILEDGSANHQPGCIVPRAKALLAPSNSPVGAQEKE